jgi:hypothetical protein
MLGLVIVIMVLVVIVLLTLAAVVRLVWSLWRGDLQIESTSHGRQLFGRDGKNRESG